LPGAGSLTLAADRLHPSARRYLKIGFGGAHTDSNQRLMYTSA
jgi:hypothetical protein